MKNTVFAFLCFALCAIVKVSLAQEISFQEHVELGEIHWLRSYHSATAESQKKEKPILVLFQEVPGCITCSNYGKKNLSHPIIVETIEQYFVPLCIHNNKKGEDKKILDRFSEPTWNNPVVRVINTEGKDLVNRLGNNYSLAGLVQTLRTAITASNQLVPDYLNLLAQQLEAEKKETAYLSMYCFWTGEKAIGQIPGVIETEAGFMHGKEVVKTTYNPQLVNLETIEKEAKKSSCADQVYTKEKNYRTDKEVKYYLQKSKYKSIPMFAMQAMKVNVALGQGLNPESWLSPRQLSLLQNKSKRNYVGKDFVKSWYEVYK